VNLLLVSAVVLSACIGIVLKIVPPHDATAGAGDIEGRGVGGREALRLLGASRHLTVTALVIGFAAGGATIIEQQLNMALGGMEARAIAAFLAKVTVYISVAGFIVQVAFTSRLHRSFGLAAALLLLPLGLGTSAFVILVSGTLWAPAVARVLDSSLRYTVDKTSREVLFLPLPTDLKYRAKLFVDVTVDRFAKAAAALLMLVLIKPWGFGLDWRRLSYASLTVTALWIATALYARREYLKTFRRSIGERGIAPEAVRIDAADAATVETLVEELSNPDEGPVLYAIEMLEAFDKRHLITPLLLHHDSPRVRARALHAIAAARSRIGVRWVSTVERMIHDDDVDVRAAALRALAALSSEEPTALMRRQLDDPAPRVVVAAAVGLAQSGEVADVDDAEAALARLIGDTREAAAAGRREAAAALAYIPGIRFRLLLVPLLHDADASVTEEAIKSARLMGAPDGLFLPGLISLLAHRTLKGAARDTLVSYGLPVVPTLAHVLSDRNEYRWIRRHIPATLARIASQESMDALVAALDDADGFLRYKSIVAIEHLRREAPGLTFPRADVETLLVAETTRYYSALTLRDDLMRIGGDADASLVGRALGDKLRRTLDRAYRLAGLLHGADDVAASRYAIEEGDARRRTAAIEYLDNVLSGAIRRRLLPILDETPMAEKVRHAHALLKSRPRDAADTLAQLLHDDDPVIAAAAIHFAVHHPFQALDDDLAYVIARRSSADRIVVDAAVWAGSLRRMESGREAAIPLPAVELAHRLRTLPLFAFLSVDELLAIADEGEEVHYPAGREVFAAGERARRVEFLIDGAVRDVDARGDTREIKAPAVFGLEEVLQDAAVPHFIRAAEHAVSVRIAADVFLAMVANNVLLAQGLFRMVLLRDVMSRTPPAFGPGLHGLLEEQLTLPPPPLDRSQPLRQHPWLDAATPAQFLALLGTARERILEPGGVVFEADQPAALYLVLGGAVTLRAGEGNILAREGAVIGLAETLAGLPAGWRATAEGRARVVSVDREDLFGVLCDHIGLMQSVFRSIMADRVEPPNIAVALP
jgi:CRP-like cAMP-binding protein